MPSFVRTTGFEVLKSNITVLHTMHDHWSMCCVRMAFEPALTTEDERTPFGWFRGWFDPELATAGVKAGGNPTATPPSASKVGGDKKAAFARSYAAGTAPTVPPLSRLCCSSRREPGRGVCVFSLRAVRPFGHRDISTFSWRHGASPEQGCELRDTCGKWWVASDVPRDKRWPVKVWQVRSPYR